MLSALHLCAGWRVAFWYSAIVSVTQTWVSVMSDSDLTNYQKEEIRLRERELDLRALEIKIASKKDVWSLWSSPVVAAIFTGVIAIIAESIVSYQQSAHQFRLSYDQDRAQMAVDILRSDPDVTGPAIRGWAMNVLDETSSVPLPEQMPEDLWDQPRPGYDRQQ